MLVGSFGYVHYEGRGPTEKLQPSDYCWSFCDIPLIAVSHECTEWSDDGEGNDAPEYSD